MRPVGLMMLALLHLITDDDEVRSILDTLVGALAPGSFVALSHACLDVDVTHTAVKAWNERHPAPAQGADQRGDRGAVRRPGIGRAGIVSCARWRPEPNPWGEPQETMTFWSGVARKLSCGAFVRGSGALSDTVPPEAVLGAHRSGREHSRAAVPAPVPAGGGGPAERARRGLLRGPSPLERGERELIAAYVSELNGCRFCASSHGACAAAQLPGGMTLVQQVHADPDAAPVSAKLKALLAIAAAVQRGGREVGDAHIAAARW